MTARDTFEAKFVGRPVERIEDLPLLRGDGCFVDDVHLPGTLHAAVLRSSVAHGRIRKIDVSAARAMSGVHAVFTASDVAQSLGGLVPTIPLRLMVAPELTAFEQPVIAEVKVRYVGEPLAMVVADSAARAEDALEAIDLDIEMLPAITDRRASLSATALLFEKHGSNLAVRYQAAKGESPSGRAPYVKRERFAVHRHTAVCMETRGLLATWDSAKGHLTVRGAAKVPFSTRRILARTMDLPESRIDMVELDVGGSFGVRGEFYPEDFLVPFAARMLDRPVKWIEDRRENLLATNHAREMDCELEIACARDGTILSLQGDVWVDAGAYMRASAAIPPRSVTHALAGPYRVPFLRITSHVLLTNKTPTGTYRGPGRFEGEFFRERLFDLAARDLGLDPSEFRRRNLVAPADMPYLVATVTPPETRTILDTGDYGLTLDRCLAEIGWRDKAALQGRLVGGRYHGLGIGCFAAGGGVGPRESARIAIEQDGTFSVYVGSTNVGQGIETICSQIAADALGVPMERIRVFHGSTTYLNEGFGSYHSRSTVMGGSAILVAVETLRKRVREAAAHRLGGSPEEIVLGPALCAWRGTHSLTLQELARDGLSAEHAFSNAHLTYSYGAAAAHVAVDARTGHVEVLDYVHVEDLGRIINPLTATGQAVGGIVQALGGTFLEHLQYDDEGQLLTASLADYMLPTAGDFPNVRAIVLEHARSSSNPLGAKGGGEGSTGPVPGVVANAIAAALADFGVQPRELPLTPERIWRLMQERTR
jgi:carbon-monoxide dehydrogenase large subunit